MKKLHAYILGFALSLMLTGCAFGIVQLHLMSGHVSPSHEVAVPILVVLALLQLVVQLVLFLHLGQEEKPRWNLLAFSFALIVVGILVGGSLWIMSHLNHMQEQPNIFEEENIFPHEHAGN